MTAEESQVVRDTQDRLLRERDDAHRAAILLIAVIEMTRECHGCLDQDQEALKLYAQARKFLKLPEQDDER